MAVRVFRGKIVHNALPDGDHMVVQFKGESKTVRVSMQEYKTGSKLVSPKSTPGANTGSHGRAAAGEE